MAKFTAIVVSKVPHYYEAEVVIEADNQQEAKKLIKQMYAADELDFDEGEADYDEAEISEIKFEGGNKPVKLVERIPKNYEVQPLKPGEKAEDKATCGHCGLSWDDAKSTSMTPTPSGRCPFESFHIYPDED